MGKPLDNRECDQLVTHGQLVGPKSLDMADTRHSLVRHTKWLLHLLGRLRCAHRCHYLYLIRARPSCRFRPFLVGDLSRELGEFAFIQPMAMDPYRFDCLHVYFRDHSHWPAIRLFRGLGLHAQSVFHHVQSHILHRHHCDVCTPSCTRIQPSFRSCTICNGCCILHISYCFCHYQPYA